MDRPTVLAELSTATTAPPRMLITRAPPAEEAETKAPPQRAEQRAADRWPHGLALSFALSCCLAAALALPVLSSRALGPNAALIAPALLSCCLLSRLIFSARAWSRLGGGFGAHAAAAGCSAGAGIALTALAAGVEIGPVAPAALAAAAPIAAGALLVAPGLRRLEVRSLASARRVFFVGTNVQRRAFQDESYEAGVVEIVGEACLDDREGINVGHVVRRVSESRATMLVLSDEAIRDERLVAMAAELNLSGLRVRDLRTFYEEHFGKVAVSELTPSWFFFDVAEIHRHRIYGGVKRLLEVATSVLVLLLVAPLLPLAALAIKLSSKGPVLFRQTRVGKHGQLFSLTKLRTMHSHPGARELWAGECEESIFPVGRLLRKFHADELPQLWNVIRGDLSLVGPRPEQPEIAARLERTMPYYSARQHVRPGVTGWAQIRFGYGGCEATTLAKLQYDLFYIKHQSLSLDLRIIARTARTILSGTGR